MSRVSPLRTCTVAGLAAGTIAAGIALAPTALAAEPLPALTGPSTVAAGADFEVSGADCVTTDPLNPAVALVTTDVELDDPNGVGLVVVPEDDGTWSAVLSFPAGTTGVHQVLAGCGQQYAEQGVQYPEFDITVTAPTAGTPSTPATPTTTATPTTPATGAIRGTAANTPGVASPDTGAATGDRSAPGRKVVKVLTGFKPGEVVTVTLHSTPQRVASATADASGTVRIEFTLPAGTPAGEHTLVYEGSQGTYFQEAFTVTAAAGSGASLAYTGASVALPLGLGAGALALGGGLVFLTRRRSAEATQA
ncbi:hypothetical protein [Geodermatophilus normandii]|uniref:LPXTG cell wall anchor domain-containing protein n=1 Tax=Geodermatophilus normandii TaxID=1137989 RepID=A0A6P0GJ16_9ACTN|nr:hypothetical protein [Geodermatophilus normandii]NEM07267.1 hypothetical protein [Geodermatophilus normandii]